MTIKVHDTENFQDLEFNGHQAPVLSVAIDPKRKMLILVVSSNSGICQGSFKMITQRYI